MHFSNSPYVVNALHIQFSDLISLKTLGEELHNLFHNTLLSLSQEITIFLCTLFPLSSIMPAYSTITVEEQFHTSKNNRFSNTQNPYQYINTLKPKLVYIIRKDSVPISKTTQHVSITDISYLVNDVYRNIRYLPYES